MFFIFFLIGAISSYILIGGPKTIVGPISVFMGFCLAQFFLYKTFKKENK